MPGIYIHIPFCEKKCNYCDFYKSTDTAEKERFIKVVRRELWYSRDYLNDLNIETIYLGGGTPSVLKPDQLKEILLSIKSVFNVSQDAEITMEMNPDDITIKYLEEIRVTGINRISIGIQSFSSKDLIFMGRRHNARQALDAVINSKKAGFKNISIDLIYGVPGMSVSQWKENLKKAMNLDVQHISAYHLTYHENTPLGINLQKGTISEVSEEESLEQFSELINISARNGFIHYEVSNFAKEGFFSRHNSSYWKQVKYLGLGPSAHSYNGYSRQWNVSDLKKYLNSDFRGKDYFEIEELSLNDRFNDYILTSLRTMWGIDLYFIKDQFGKEYLKHVLNISENYLKGSVIEKDENIIRLTKSGFFISDKIISNFIH